ncbi:hypothetical protein AAVH_43606, partial [Aphelenchoides avenae]
MALWPHQHLRKALEQYWNICSKQQLILREIPAESSEFVTKKSELQCFRSELASILRVIRIVANIYVFGPVTTGASAHLVEAYFFDEWLPTTDHYKQFARAIIDDITIQLHSCDAALRDIEAHRSWLVFRRPQAPAAANALRNAGNPV